MPYFRPIDWRGVVERVRREDAITVPRFLREDAIEKLLHEAERYAWTPAPETVEPYGIEQRFEFISEFPELSVFHDVQCSLEMHLDDALYVDAGIEQPHVTLSDMRAQRYQPGPLGVSPHRDGKKYQRLIAVLILSGNARFCVCDDRSGAGERAIRNEPGDMVLLRGEGLSPGKDRPYHFVDRISEERISLAFREARM